MHDEIRELKENGTYELFPIPKDNKIIGGGGVCVVKLRHNKEEHFKARYATKEYSYLQNIDCQATFSLAAIITSIRTLIQQATQDNLIIHQTDFKTTPGSIVRCMLNNVKRFYINK